MKSEEGKYGQRTDGADLIKEWIKDKEIQGVPYDYIWNRNGLLNVNKSNIDYLLGKLNKN